MGNLRQCHCRVTCSRGEASPHGGGGPRTFVRYRREARIATVEPCLESLNPLPTTRSLTMNFTRRLIVAAAAASALAASAGLSTAALAATPAAAAQPSVVIVHGAFADGSDWAKVIPLLQREGVQVTAVQNPLSSLADDVAAARRAIDAQPGKVVLVGHSWGGTVITEAGTSDKVASLVYVAAFAPNVGQNTAEQGKGFPTPSGSAHFKADAQGWLSLTAEGMKNHFA